jgi:hypothetical protein
MRKSTFSEPQIVGILQEAESGSGTADHDAWNAQTAGV